MKTKEQIAPIPIKDIKTQIFCKKGRIITPNETLHQINEAFKKHGIKNDDAVYDVTIIAIKQAIQMGAAFASDSLYMEHEEIWKIYLDLPSSIADNLKEVGVPKDKIHALLYER